jgi:hypothetical protein
MFAVAVVLPTPPLPEVIVMIRPGIHVLHVDRNPFSLLLHTVTA